MSDWAKDINKYHHNLITLGDFNIDKRVNLLNKTFIEKGLCIPNELADEKVTRSIFDETKYYDQIAWFKDKNGKSRLDFKFKSGGRYDFLETMLLNRGLTKNQKSWMISDHYPLWAESEL